MNIENKTLEILDLVREKVLSPDEALPHILRLFSVVGRSEQLLAFLEWLDQSPEENANRSREDLVKDYLSQ
jgi:hypothetical protein